MGNETPEGVGGGARAGERVFIGGDAAGRKERERGFIQSGGGGRGAAMAAGPARLGGHGGNRESRGEPGKSGENREETGERRGKPGRTPRGAQRNRGGTGEDLGKAGAAPWAGARPGRITDWVRLEASSVSYPAPAPCSSRIALERVSQHCVQVLLEHGQGGELHTLSGQCSNV